MFTEIIHYMMSFTGNDSIQTIMG